MFGISQQSSRAEISKLEQVYYLDLDLWICLDASGFIDRRYWPVSLRRGVFDIRQTGAARGYSTLVDRVLRVETKVSLIKYSNDSIFDHYGKERELLICGW